MPLPLDIISGKSLLTFRQSCWSAYLAYSVFYGFFIFRFHFSSHDPIKSVLVSCKCLVCIRYWKPFKTHKTHKTPFSEKIFSKKFFRRKHYYDAFLPEHIRSTSCCISSERQTVMLSPILIGWGYLPFFTPSHQDDLDIGMMGGVLPSPIICFRRRKLGDIEGISLMMVVLEQVV